METLGTIIGYFLFYMLVAVILRTVLYGFLLNLDLDLEKFSIKLKSKLKPKLTEPIYNLVKSEYYDHYTIKKYEMIMSIEYFKTTLLVLLIYPIFYYHWQYEVVDTIKLKNISDDDVFKYTKNDFIEMFDKRESERKIKDAKEKEIEKKTNDFNEEFENNYNKLNK